jgi:hypothetical protein
MEYIMDLQALPVQHYGLFLLKMNGMMITTPDILFTGQQFMAVSAVILDIKWGLFIPVSTHIFSSGNTDKPESAP